MIYEKTPLASAISEEERAQMADTDREFELYRQILEELAPSGYAPLELTKLVRDGLDRYDYMELRRGGEIIPWELFLRLT